MERKVKERFVGAAVLVAIAVILIPELLSGPKTRQKPAPPAAANEQRIKTYEFNLDPSAAPSSPVTESPAAPPAEEAPPAAAPEPEARSTEPVATVVDPPRVPAPAAQPATAPPAAVPERAPQAAPLAESRPLAPAPAASASGWAVQLGSFADEDRARKLVQRLEAAGHNAYLVPLRRADGKTLQRVRIGPYERREAAEAALKKVASEAKGAAVVPQS